MKNKSSTQKLTLNTEIVRALRDLPPEDLSPVRGGMASGPACSRLQICIKTVSDG